MTGDGNKVGRSKEQYCIGTSIKVNWSGQADGKSEHQHFRNQ